MFAVQTSGRSGMRCVYGHEEEMLALFYWICMYIYIYFFLMCMICIIHDWKSGHARVHALISTSIYATISQTDYFQRWHLKFRRWHLKFARERIAHVSTCTYIAKVAITFHVVNFKIQRVEEDSISKGKCDFAHWISAKNSWILRREMRSDRDFINAVMHSPYYHHTF